MLDPFSQFRSFTGRAALLRSGDTSATPRIIGVCAAASGVGTTTIAAKLGQALVEQGARVVLVDADSRQGNLAQTCGVEIPGTYDPAAAQHDIHEALLRAPGGLQIVPGVWPGEPSEKAAEQLLRQFHSLGRHADLLVLDLGVATEPVLRIWTDIFETHLVVATAGARSAVNAYKLIKQSLVAEAGRGLELLVNKANAAQADDVLARVDRSCRKFLGFGVQLAGHAPPGVQSEHLIPLAMRLCDAGRRASQRQSA